jgi:hypothetical protein
MNSRPTVPPLPSIEANTMPSCRTRASFAGPPCTCHPACDSPRFPPTSPTDPVAPRVIAAKPWNVLPVGRLSSSSWEITCCVRTFCTSTTGLAPVTTTVSSIAPSRISALAGAVKPVVSAMPSRRTVLKPGSENVTV